MRMGRGDGDGTGRRGWASSLHHKVESAATGLPLPLREGVGGGVGSTNDRPGCEAAARERDGCGAGAVATASAKADRWCSLSPAVSTGAVRRRLRVLAGPAGHRGGWGTAWGDAGSGSAENGVAGGRKVRGDPVLEQRGAGQHRGGNDGDPEQAESDSSLDPSPYPLPQGEGGDGD